jgi:hypothetical protein
MQLGDLPPLDVHATNVATGVENVWPAVLETVDRAFSGPWAGRYARVVGCVPRSASGPRPLAEGSTLPGFRVVAAIPESELVLEGRHRFASYGLIVRLEPLGTDRSRLTAETRAAFPGRAGALYRLLVVGTGVHVIAVRRLLSHMKGR